MRRIGLVENASHAAQFCDYLLTRGITATSEAAASDASQHEIWVKDETKVQEAKAELQQFLAAPQDAKYAVQAEANQRRQQQAAENLRRLKNQQAAAQRRFPSSSSERPLIVLIFMGLCIGAGLLTGFQAPRILVTSDGQLAPIDELQWFNALSYVGFEDAKRTDNPFASIMRGEVWRLLTPTLLHGSLGHLAMNMLGLFFLGSAIERLQGRWQIALLILITAIVGFFVQALWPESNGGGPTGIGASGVVYGLFGYIWMRPYYDSNFMLQIPPSGLFLAFLFLLLGVAGVIPNIANGAHIGGLVAGMLCAVALRNPTKGGTA